MSKDALSRLRTLLQSDQLTEQGLRLTNAFHKLRDAHDRERVIDLAEQLLDAQNAKLN
jgi:hypothetical protein